MIDFWKSHHVDTIGSILRHLIPSTTDWKAKSHCLSGVDLSKHHLGKARNGGVVNGELRESHRNQISNPHHVDTIELIFELSTVQRVIGRKSHIVCALRSPPDIHNKPLERLRCPHDAWLEQNRIVTGSKTNLAKKSQNIKFWTFWRLDRSLEGKVPSLQWS